MTTDVTHKMIYLILWVWLISTSEMASGFIHAVTNSRVSLTFKGWIRWNLKVTSICISLWLRTLGYFKMFLSHLDFIFSELCLVPCSIFGKVFSFLVCFVLLLFVSLFCCCSFVVFVVLYTFEMLTLY